MRLAVKLYRKMNFAYRLLCATIPKRQILTFPGPSSPLPAQAAGPFAVYSYNATSYKKIWLRTHLFSYNLYSFWRFRYSWLA